MRIRKAAGIILSAMTALSCSCGGAGSQTDMKGTNAMTETVFEASEKNVKTLGRTYFDEGLLWCAFSGTGAGFSVTGTKCSVTIKADRTVKTANNDDNLAHIAIYLDGERVIDDMINEAEKSYTVFEGESERTAEVKIIKLSETAMSCMAIKDIKVTGGRVEPLPEKELFIEFVGDSITCGYGVDDENELHHFKTSTEDVTKAYAYRTAEALGADYSLVSISGYGIISGYTDNGKKIPAQTIPKYYEKLGFSYGGSEDFFPQDTRWDFSKREPDVIVINLGTNDDSYCRDDREKQTEYRDSYIEFVKKVRKNNPNAKLVLALGIMGDRLFPTVEEVADLYKKETGDDKIYTVHLEPQLLSDGYAADYHPTAVTHKKAAEKMTEALREIIKE